MARILAVVGHGPELEREDGAARMLRSLGAEVFTHHLWDDAALLIERAAGLRIIIIETLNRPDYAAQLTRSLRTHVELSSIPLLVAVSAAQVAQLDYAAGFNDFLVHPYLADELYARIRRLEWLASEFNNDERMKIGTIVIDKQAQEVRNGGALVALTQRERALLIYLCERRGRAASRRELLARVWGTDYQGGPRTVDIHVRRLRKKLGKALPLRTLHGVGYRVDGPAGDGAVEGTKQTSYGSKK